MGLIETVRSWFGVDDHEKLLPGHKYQSKHTQEPFVVRSIATKLVEIERQDADRRPVRHISRELLEQEIGDTVVHCSQCQRCQQDRERSE